MSYYRIVAVRPIKNKYVIIIHSLAGFMARIMMSWHGVAHIIGR